MYMHLEPSEPNLNSFEEIDCENANTLAHVGTHLVVLAHFEKEVESLEKSLTRRWPQRHRTLHLHVRCAVSAWLC